MVMGDMHPTVDLLVIGGGPAGYAAAFRAADLGLDVALVDPRPLLGGVCLHEGCIPSKSYLAVAELIEDVARAENMGLHFSQPAIDINKIRSWKNGIVAELADGLARLSDKRSIQRFQGRARFQDSTSVRLEGAEVTGIRFRKAIIASGSLPVAFAGRSGPLDEGTVMSSREALELEEIPADLLIIGGGYVGLELGSVYAALGSRVHLVELRASLLEGVDRDLLKPLQRRLAQLFARIDLQTRVEDLRKSRSGVEAQIATPSESLALHFDKVLVAMGRRPQVADLDLEKTGVKLTEAGFIRVDEHQCTDDEKIFAAGDVCGPIMLAHCGMRQGRVAAEAAAGLSAGYDVRAVPAVVYTDPQLAWCGLTETEATNRRQEFTVSRYLWKHSGRARTMGGEEGITKIIAEKDTGRIAGVGICGRNAEAMISEAVMAIEMGVVVEDLALMLHPHPTLSETLGEAAEIFLGRPTHFLPKDSR